MAELLSIDLPELVPALSLWQPWATVMLAGPKDLENRPWRTGYRGPMLVHAALTGVDLTAEKFATIAAIWPEFRALEVSGLAKGRTATSPAADAPFPRGFLLGIVEVVGCAAPEAFPGNPWAWGPYCHQWARRRAFVKPIPYKGHQGIFAVPRSVVLGAHLREAA